MDRSISPSASSSSSSSSKRSQGKRRGSTGLREPSLGHGRSHGEPNIGMDQSGIQTVPTVSLNADILILIVEHIRGPQFDGSDLLIRNTLAALARTCKAISKTALNALWSCLRDFRPIRHLLKCAAERCKPPKRQAEIKNAQWKLFTKYRDLVRSIAIRARPSTKFDLFFLAFRGHTPVFPKLERLYWSISDMNDIILLRAFITPGLHTLSITSRIPIPDVFPIVTDLESDELYANTMEEICEVASGLRKLSLHQFWPFSHESSRLMMHAISTNSQQLEELCVDATLLASPYTLHDLSSLPRLHTLSIRDFCSLSHYPPLVFFKPVEEGFSSLRTLRLALPIRYAHDVLHALPRCDLTTVSIVSKTFGGYVDLEKFSYKFGNTLWDVHLCVDCLNPENKTSLSMDHLAPLTSLNLAHLHLNCSLLMSDDVCAQLALSLPRIETLSLRTNLRTSRTEDTDKVTTLQALVPFAHHCRKLRALTIGAQVIFEEWGYIELPADYSPSPLKELNLSVRAPQDMLIEGVAFFIMRLFPNLELIGPGPENGSSGDVKGLLGLIANAQHCHGKKCEIVRFSR